MDSKKLNLVDLDKLTHMGEEILNSIGIITPVNCKPINLQASSHYEGRLITAFLISSEYVPFKSDRDRLVIYFNQQGAEQSKDNTNRVIKVFIRRDDGYEYSKAIAEYTFKSALYSEKNEVGLQNTIKLFVKRYRRYKSPDFLIGIKKAVSNL